MDRTTFCKMLEIAKKRANKSTSDICFTIRKLPTEVRRIERGFSNFGMSKCVTYLGAIEHQLYIEKYDGSKYYVFWQYDDIVRWLKKEMRGLHYPKVNRDLGFSRSYLQKIVDNKIELSIDKFLQIVEYFDCDVQLINGNMYEK